MLPSKTFGHCVFTDRVSHVVCHWIFACPVCVSHAPNLGSLFSICLLSLFSYEQINVSIYYYYYYFHLCNPGTQEKKTSSSLRSHQMKQCNSSQEQGKKDVIRTLWLIACSILGVQHLQVTLYSRIFRIEFLLYSSRANPSPCWKNNWESTT